MGRGWLPFIGSVDVDLTTVLLSFLNEVLKETKKETLWFFPFIRSTNLLLANINISLKRIMLSP